MAKANFWEVKNCGRQPGGAKEKELGVCPATVNLTNASRNGWKPAGRYCWKVAGTLCGGRVQGSFVEKMGDCASVTFSKR